MAKKKSLTRGKVARRRYTKEFREEAVQMLLDGHSAVSVAERLGLSGTNVGNSRCSPAVVLLLVLWSNGFGRSKRNCGALGRSVTS
jgi:hypothetical protein